MQAALSAHGRAPGMMSTPPGVRAAKRPPAAPLWSGAHLQALLQPARSFSSRLFSSQICVVHTTIANFQHWAAEDRRQGRRLKGTRPPAAPLKNVRASCSACVHQTGAAAEGCEGGQHSEAAPKGVCGRKSSGVVGGIFSCGRDKAGPQGRQATSGLRRPHDRASTCGLRRG